MEYLKDVLKIDPETARALKLELDRQRNKIELIASENFVSPAVMAAQGTVLTNKYAEGYPGKRYYGGCEYVDIVENLARERAKDIFQAEYANVQPHAGAQANTAVYLAFLQPNDVVLGMDLAHGGHLTHGSAINISGKYFRFYSYGVDPETERIDYDEVLRLAKECRPKLIVAGASAYPRVINFARFQEIAQEVGAKLMVDMAHIAGLVAAGYHPNPVPFSDVVTTTTHKTLRGPRGGMILCREEYGEMIDKAVFPGIQGGPLMHVIAAKAVALKEAQEPDFNKYQEQILKNSVVLAEALAKRNFRLVSGGTDNHLILIDLRNKEMTGKEAVHLLDEVGITVNKNAIPFDPQSPIVTSGIRVGTPAITTRGMREEAVDKIAQAIDLTLSYHCDAGRLETARRLVRELAVQYPLYEGLESSC